MNWFTEFSPRFSHLVSLLACVVVFAAGATILEDYETLSMILYACAGFAGFVAWAWVRMLVAESATRRMVSQQDAERANMQAVIEFARVLGDKLPPAALLSTISHAFPALDLDQVHLPDEGTQTMRTADGWNMRRTIPGGLATPEQYQILAHGYFVNKSGLPIRYWTEVQDGKLAVFGRRQFEKLLEALVENGMATKSAGGETMLNEYGENWLREYHHSPTDPGFTPIRQ